MSEPDIDHYFYLLENPVRRRLLELLSREELYPLQMARELGISPTGVMKHLNLLEEAGLVGSRSMSSPQGPPRKVYASTAGFAIRVAVGPNTFEQRIVRLTGDATLPTVQDADQGLVRVQRHRSRSGETIRVTITENEGLDKGEVKEQGKGKGPGKGKDQTKARGDIEVLGPETHGGSDGVKATAETSSHEMLKKRVRVAVTQARQLDPRSRLSLFAHVIDEMEKALADNAMRHKELLELKRLVQGEVGHMAHETGCTYDERKVLYCRLDHPTAPVSRMAELTDLREGIIRELEARLRARHLLDEE